MGHVSATTNELEMQAPRTVRGYMMDAARAADDFEIPKAERTRFLLEFARVCAMDFATAVLVRAIEDGLEGVASALNNIAENTSAREAREAQDF